MRPPRLRSGAMALMVLLLATAGCTQAKIYATPGNDISLASTQGAAYGQPFTVSKRYLFNYSSSVDARKFLVERLGPGKRVENLTVVIKTDGVDWLFNRLTLGFANSHKVEMTGNVTGD